MSLKDLKITPCFCESSVSKISFRNVSGTAWSVHCWECDTSTDEFKSAHEALEAWNKIMLEHADVESAEYDEEEESEEESDTVASLVRMLENALHVPTVVNNHMSTNYVVPELTKRIEQLEGICDRYERDVSSKEAQINKLQESLDATAKSLSRYMESKQHADNRIQSYKDSLFLIDSVLLSIDLAKNESRVSPIMTAPDLLKGIRGKWPPEENPTKFKSPLGEIVWLSSPHGSCPKPKLYKASLTALLWTGEGIDHMRKSAYGFAMSTFRVNSRGYNLAWEALGRPGATSHSEIPPRT